MLLRKISLPMVFIFSVIVISLALFSFTAAQTWTPPTASAPAGNADKPINVGSIAQTKAGDFGVTTNIFATNIWGSWIVHTLYNRASVEMRSNRYCNYDGTICNPIEASMNQWRKYYSGNANELTPAKNAAFCMIERFENGGCDSGFQPTISQDASGYWRVNQYVHGDCDRTPYAVYACIGV